MRERSKGKERQRSNEEKNYFVHPCCGERREREKEEGEVITCNLYI